MGASTGARRFGERTATQGINGVQRVGERSLYTQGPCGSTKPHFPSSRTSSGPLMSHLRYVFTFYPMAVFRLS